jgi:hypothetical protein
MHLAIAGGRPMESAEVRAGSRDFAQHRWVCITVASHSRCFSSRSSHGSRSADSLASATWAAQRLGSDCDRCVSRGERSLAQPGRPAHGAKKSASSSPTCWGASFCTKCPHSGSAVSSA